MPMTRRQKKEQTEKVLNPGKTFGAISSFLAALIILSLTLRYFYFIKDKQLFTIHATIVAEPFTTKSRLSNAVVSMFSSYDKIKLK